MRQLLASTFHSLGNWLQPKAVPQALTGQRWSGTQYVDAYTRNRQPTPNELMAKLKNPARACVILNSAVCANNPRSFTSSPTPATPGPSTRPRPSRRKPRTSFAGRAKHLTPTITKAATIEAVTERLLNALLANCKPVHNAFDLWT